MSEELKPCAVFLCDYTGNMAKPWADAGVQCFCVDVKHPFINPRIDGNITFIWGDVRTWTPPSGYRPIFAFAQPPCTHVAGSGSRHFAQKRGMMLRDALETFEASHLACAWSGAPYAIENSVGVLSTISHLGKPDYYFHPYEYAGWNPDDNYTKKTCLWTGNGFVMPRKNPLPNATAPDDRIHKASPGTDRGDVRSAAPIGFSRAVFDANYTRAITAWNTRAGEKA